jgi:hypothetical protein
LSSEEKVLCDERRHAGQLRLTVIELRREEEAIPLQDRIAALRAEARAPTGETAGKALFDDFSDHDR